MAVFQVVSIVIAALVLGVFWGPWVGLTSSIASFDPPTFLAIVGRLSRNLAPVMTVLMPAALVSMLPVLILAYHGRRATFVLTLAALGCYAVALVVTVVTEVPIVKRMQAWTPATLPANWELQRDRWASFHLIRLAAAVAGLTLLVIGATAG
jgi:Domain of unknown function (DUF1772)